jgi:protein-S-isoprenylcysteine O-methyltransferase Ste14
MGMDLFKPLAYSLALIVIASAWVLKYRAVRRDRKYSEGRQPICSDDRFKVLGQMIFVAMNALTLASFWTDSRILLLFGQSDTLRLVGMIVLIAATLLYAKSLSQLGDNYSPCFDAHVPFRIVTNGPYSYIRHPLYLANILQGVGYILTSGSLWVSLLAGYGIFIVILSLVREESYLVKEFPEYEPYRAKTSRLIPFIY